MRTSTTMAWYGPPLVALGASLWATDAVFRSAVVSHYSALFIVFVNHALCFVPALPVMIAERRTLARFRARDWAALAVVAALGSVVAMVCFTKAFATASNYTVPILIQKLQPVFAIVLARVVLKERLAAGFAIWATVAMLGAYLVSFGFTNVAAGITAAEGEAILLALLAAAIWGATTVAGRVLLAGRGFLFVTAARFTFGTVAVGMAALATGDLAPLGQALRDHLGPFAGMAFISGLVPLLIYYYGLKVTPASVATLCELAFPVAAIAINWVVLASPLTAGQLVGAVLLIGAVTALTLGTARGQPDLPPKRRRAEGADRPDGAPK